MNPLLIDQYAIVHTVAAKTGRDVRTINKVLRGESVRGRACDSIRRALLELGVTPPAPAAIAREMQQIA